jgi:hypothetical protein
MFIGLRCQASVELRVRPPQHPDIVCAGEREIGMEEFCAKDMAQPICGRREVVMRIDVHAHFYPARYIDCVSRLRGEQNYRIRAAGAAVTLEERVDLLDRSGIRVQVLSVGGRQPYGADANEATSAAKLGNDLFAEVCTRHGGHFAAFAALPLPHIDAALFELTRALDDLGMLGVNLGCSVAGRPLDDTAFAPVFAELDRRGRGFVPPSCGLWLRSAARRLRLEFSSGRAVRRHRCRATIDSSGNCQPLPQDPHYRASPRRHTAVSCRTPRRLSRGTQSIQAQRVLETAVVRHGQWKRCRAALCARRFRRGSVALRHGFSAPGGPKVRTVRELYRAVGADLG